MQLLAVRLKPSGDHLHLLLNLQGTRNELGGITLVMLYPSVTFISRKTGKSCEISIYFYALILQILCSWNYHRLST